MSGFDVEQAALPSTRAVVVEVADRLQTGIGDMNATMTNLLSGGWSGQAATAFRAGFDEWLEGAQRVLTSLRSAGVALGDTAAQYRDQDAVSADLMNRLGGGL